MALRAGAPSQSGASGKGRIWSHCREQVDQLVQWHRKAGIGLLDASIKWDEVLKSALENEATTIWRAGMPICVDWPEEIYTAPEALWFAVIGDRQVSIEELILELLSPSTDGDLLFAIVGNDMREEFPQELFEQGDTADYQYLPAESRTVFAQGVTENYPLETYQVHLRVLRECIATGVRIPHGRQHRPNRTTIIRHPTKQRVPRPANSSHFNRRVGTLGHLVSVHAAGRSTGEPADESTSGTTAICAALRRVARFAPIL